MAQVTAQLPVIDISCFLPGAQGDDAAKQHAAEQMRSACTEVGFFYVSGHGLPSGAVESMLSASQALFTAPAEIKQSLAAANSPLWRGYNSFGGAHNCTPEDGQADLKESFTLGMERGPGDARAPTPMHGPNQWPAEADLPGWRGTVERYMHDVLGVSHAVMRCLARSLGQGEGFFVAAADDPVAQLVLLRYPPVPTPQASAQASGGGGSTSGRSADGADVSAGSDNVSAGSADVSAGGADVDASSDGAACSGRGAGGAGAAACNGGGCVGQGGGGGGAGGSARGCGAHTDCGFLTLLAQDDVGGLEVQMADGCWVPAPPVPGALLVNLGDMTARWTNDLYRSTLHRVASPHAGVRHSAVFFVNCNFDAVVEAIPGTGQPKYEPVMAGRYILQKLGLMWLMDGHNEGSGVDSQTAGAAAADEQG